MKRESYHDRVSYHDCTVVIQINLGTQFVYQVNGVVGPSLCKSQANNKVEQINNVIYKKMYTMFEEFHMECLLVSHSTGVHLPQCILNI